jgi:hypothetical protein
MIDPLTQAVLQALLRRESRSLLQYTADSFPWATGEEAGALAQLRQIIDEERAGLAQVGRFLTRHHAALPYLGAYSTEFTTSNFVALDHLLPRLAAEERRAVMALEQDRTALSDSEGRTLVEGFLDQKRQHLKTLESLAASHSPRAA